MNQSLLKRINDFIGMVGETIAMMSADQNTTTVIVERTVHHHQVA